MLAIDEAIPPEPANNASAVIKAAYEKHKNDSNDITCLMLATMPPEMQKQFLEIEAFAIHAHLTEMFQEQVRHERFMTIKALNSCKMVPGSSVSAHVLKMKGYMLDFVAQCTQRNKQKFLCKHSIH